MFNLLSRLVDRRRRWGILVLTLLLLAGCGDFFTQKPTELQTQVILNELRKIEENKNVKNPLPDLYRHPAEKIEVRDGYKLFYFSKQHSADKLAELVNAQFSELFGSAPTKETPTAKEHRKPEYLVSPNPATNQLVVHCPTSEEADKVLEFLEKVDVPPIQVHIDCLILERFADVTMDWETSVTIYELFGEHITLGTKDGPEFPGASLREPKRSEFGLDIGYWNQELPPDEFRVVVDMLISRGYLRVLMNPTLETMNGQQATISTREYAPLDKILSQAGFAEPFNLTDYQWVEDKLEVTPHVYADGSIGLQTEVVLGSRAKPEGVVQTSIITERYVKVGENRIEPGHSLVVGGVRKSEERSVIRGVPLLKDIPVIGVLFSSKDYEEKATEVIFVLTPSISSGGVEYTKVIENMRQKRARPEYGSGLQEAITDPLGAAAYTSHIEQQAARAEFERLKAEIEKAQALEEVDQIKEKLLETAEQAIIEKAKAEKAHTDALKAKKEAQEAKAEIEKAKVEIEKIRADIEKAKKEAQEAK
ncbi:MAG: type II secretion system protein GspD [Planctomycetota bacterium]|jgi:type II secretory pathway component GspD/PulD (secretin)